MSDSLGSGGVRRADDADEVVRRLPYVAPRDHGADEATEDLYRGCAHRPCRTCAATCYVPPDIAVLVDAGKVDVVCYTCNGMFDDYGPQVSFRGIGC